jgi:hypothetical protein
MQETSFNREIVFVMIKEMAVNVREFLIPSALGIRKIVGL